MATRIDDDMPLDGEGPMELGYAAWKRAKVESALAQTRDRTVMIPVEQVWHDLKLEG